MNSNVLINESGSKRSDLYPLSTKSTTARKGDILENFSLIEKPSGKTADPEKSQTESQTSSSTSKLLSFPKFNDVPRMLEAPIECLQEWEGYVQSVRNDDFTASLIDITNKRVMEDEEADFSINDLTEDNKKLLRPGAVFRWLIGYRTIGNTKERFSKIVFRLLPQWTERELQNSREKAKKIANTMTWE